MDALFFRQQQLVSDVQSYSNSTRNDVVVNSSSSFENSATDRDRNQNPYFLDQPTQECFSSLSVTEDEDHDHFSAASSSNHYRHPPHPHTATVSTTSIGTATPTDQRFSHFIKDLNFKFSDNWASELLLQTAIAITDNNTSRIQQFMWMLNELGSPYGDTNQKLAFYFLQAMFSRVIDSGDRCYRSLVAVSEKRSCFELTRRIELKFQEMSPWMTFGHVASNGAIMEAFEGERKLHIIDISNSFCTQWPTLLEALATRSNAEIPHLKLTMLITAKSNTTLESQKKIMKEISKRMEKFGRLMGVPFKFKPIFHSGDVSDINFAQLGVKTGEAVAVNCVGALRSVAPVGNRRDFLISLFRGLRPRIITVVEEEADLAGGGVDLVKDVQECLRWFSVYFDSLAGSFPTASNEQLAIERAAGLAVVDLLAREPAESVERRETAARWARRLHGGGFNAVSFSEDVNEDVRALLRRYKEGWTVTEDGDGAGIFLAWKEQPVVWAAAWASGPPDGEKSRRSSSSV